MTRVIGIYGKARSGKTTACAYLEKTYNIMPLAFSKALKETLNDLFDISLEELYSSYKSERTRWILQFFGTECCRTIDPLIWVKKTDDYIATLLKDNSAIIVIDDVRFFNEAEMLRNKWGAKIVKIVGPEDTVTPNELKQHISETQMDSVPDSFYDAIYHNTGTIKELHEFIDTVYRTVAEVTDDHT